MRIETILKIYPTEADIKCLTECNTYAEIADAFGIPTRTIDSWIQNGVYLNKLYSHFHPKIINKWITDTGQLTKEELVETVKSLGKKGSENEN